MVTYLTRSSNIGCSRFAFICYSLPLHLHSPRSSVRDSFLVD